MNKKAFFLLLASAVMLTNCSAPAQPVASDLPPAETGLPFSATPEEQGIDSAQLALFFQAIAKNDSMDLYSVLVQRNGVVVAEVYIPPNTANSRHEIYSVTKSFSSTLAGIAIDQGKISSVDQRVLDFFPDQTFENDSREKQAITLENLLTMTSGLDWTETDPSFNSLYRSGDWLKFMLNLPVRTPPGETFYYCSGCSHVLSAIVLRATGTRQADFAEKNLFEPIGIQGARWELDSNGIPVGGWGLSLTTRELARFGQLFLNGGRWNGKQVVSRAWVEAATQARLDTDGDWRYGYQWWIEPEYASYMALGKYGQMIFVQPETSLVVVFSARNADHKMETDMIEQLVLPAMKSSEPLPPNLDGQAQLQAALAALGK